MLRCCTILAGTGHLTLPGLAPLFVLRMLFYCSLDDLIKCIMQFIFNFQMHTDVVTTHGISLFYLDVNGLLLLAVAETIS